MPRRNAQDWADLEEELYAAGADRAEVEAGARRLLAEARRAGAGRAGGRRARPGLAAGRRGASVGDGLGEAESG
jgi:hypothetical protein